MIVEPVGGGGDLGIQENAKRSVIQWKIRQEAGTWSLQETIAEVMTDLYAAVDPDRLHTSDEHVLSTDGRMGATKRQTKRGVLCPESDRGCRTPLRRHRQEAFESVDYLIDFPQFLPERVTRFRVCAMGVVQ